MARRLLHSWPKPLYKATDGSLFNCIVTLQSNCIMVTRKPSCRWQTRATPAKSLHGLRKSSGVVESCIARLLIDGVPMVYYYVLYSNCVCKMRRDLETRVKGHSRSSKVTPFDSLHMVSYYRPIVILCLKCTIFEIWRHIGWKSSKKPKPPSFGTFFGGEPLRIFRRAIPSQKLESWSYQMVYISRSCFRSARHNTGVCQSDRRTDGQTRRCRKDPR